MLGKLLRRLYHGFCPVWNHADEPHRPAPPISASLYQYSLTSENLADLDEWAQKLMAAMQRLPQLKDISTDQQADGLRAQIVIDRALTNDRAQVTAAQAERDYAAQSLASEQTKYKLGASTTANVLQQGRNLAIADDNLISSTAAYARDRASLEQLLSITLDRYGISLNAAASGMIGQAPTIPNLTAPAPGLQAWGVGVD